MRNSTILNLNLLFITELENIKKARTKVQVTNEQNNIPQI